MRHIPMYILIIALTSGSTLASSIAAEVKPSSATTPTKKTKPLVKVTYSSEAQQASLDAMRKTLEICQNNFETRKMLDEMTFDNFVAMKNYESRGVGVSQLEKLDWVLARKAKNDQEDLAKGTCSENAKKLMNSDSIKSYLSNFKPSVHPLAKETLAQWFSTLDIVGKDNFKSEANKFTTLSNRLKIEGLTEN